MVSFVCCPHQLGSRVLLPAAVAKEGLVGLGLRNVLDWGDWDLIKVHDHPECAKRETCLGWGGGCCHRGTRSG